MLNRLFIAGGVVLIALILIGFLGPLFVDWSSYRDRMEEMASEALGAPVAIEGGIAFRLLPQPVLTVRDVKVGDAAQPDATIDTVSAELALTDFLRDRYTVTRLSVDGPQVRLVIGEDGKFRVPLRLGQGVAPNNVSIENAELSDGSLTFVDQRADAEWAVDQFDGRLQIAGLRGPFNLQGRGRFDGANYDLRLASSALNDDDAARVSASVRDGFGTFSLSAEGLLETQDAASFAGTGELRVFAQNSGDDERVRGDFVMTAEVEAGTERLLFSNYVLVPDEGLPATRLTGAISMDFGADPRFEAVVSGGVVNADVFDLPQGDGGPLGWLTAIPKPPKAGLPGTVGLDVAEFNWNGVALRNVRADLVARADGWRLDTLNAVLPGNAQFSTSGRWDELEGVGHFIGEAKFETERLDALASNWRTPDEVNVLFGVPASAEAEVEVAAGAMELRSGQFVFDGVANDFALTASVDGGLEVALDFGQLNAARSAALLSLMPAVTQLSSFAGVPLTLDARLARGVVEDTTIEDAVLAARFADGVVDVDRFTAASLGGLTLDVSGRWAGGVLAPAVSGSGMFGFEEDAEAAGIFARLRAMGMPALYQDALRRLAPGEVEFELAQPADTGEQRLVISGNSTGLAFEGEAQLGRGVFGLMNGPMVAELSMSGSDANALMEFAGFGGAPYFSSGGLAEVRLHAEGNPANSLEVNARIEAGDEALGFLGNVIVANPANPRAKGRVDVQLEDSSGLAAALGAEGLGFGPLRGDLIASFPGGSDFALTEIALNADGNQISGQLARDGSGEAARISGELRAERLDIAAVAALLGGPAALLPGDGVWPDGPLDVADFGREGQGRVSVSAPVVVLDDRVVAEGASGMVVWTGDETRVSGFTAKMGEGGEVSLEAELCCRTDPGERQFKGRVRVANVALDRVLPDVPASILDGALDLGLNFTATGSSYAELVSRLTGDGSFSISDFSVEGFSPQVFVALDEADGIVEMEEAALSAVAEQGLDAAPFEAERFGGSFTVAAGQMAANTVAIESDDARLIGSMRLRLPDLGLDGQWTLTPVDPFGPDSLLSVNTAEITAILSGTLIDPEMQLELTPMLDAIKVRAYEIEVDRLEQLRAEQEARAREAAEERARIAEEQARLEAERAAEEARQAEQQRQDEERQRALDLLLDDLGESQDPQLNNSAPPAQETPLDLLNIPLTLDNPDFPDGTTNF